MNEPTADLATQPGDDLLAELADDFLRRYRAGEQPSIDEYAAKHPELADRIRKILPAVIVMEQRRQDSVAPSRIGPPSFAYRRNSEFGSKPEYSSGWRDTSPCRRNTRQQQIGDE
jgi:hypothetical protein